MKISRYIWLVVIGLILGAVVFMPMAHADDFVDDIYYTPNVSSSDKEVHQPTYDKDVREIVFIEDSTSAPNDTVVKAIIRK